MGNEQGLSQNSIFAIYQDSKGFLWIGTEGGLNRYDGYNFKHYLSRSNKRDGLSNNYIYCITGDNHGRLWLGTDHGLNRFNYQTDTFTRYLHSPDQPNSLSNNRVFTIFQDSRDNLWVGTYNGLNLMGPDHDGFTHFKHNPNSNDSLSNNNIRAVSEDAQGLIWIGTENGLNSYDPQTKTFTRFIHVPNAKNCLSSSNITVLNQELGGPLWIGTSDGGLNLYDHHTGTFSYYRSGPDDPTSLSEDNISVLFIDLEGKLWVGTDNTGLNLFDRQNKRFRRYQSEPGIPSSLSGNRIRSLYQDRSGAFWVGTWPDGLNKNNPATRNFGRNHTVSGQGHDLSNPNVYAAGQTKDGNLWLGTYNGLNEYNPQLDTYTYYLHQPAVPDSLSSNHVRALLVDSRGTLWVGTEQGVINKLDRDRQSFSRYLLSMSNLKQTAAIRKLFEDKEGNLWVGTDGIGVLVFDPGNGTFLPYVHDEQNPDSLSYNRIRALYEAPDESGKYLWIGTFGGGLNRFNRQLGTFTHYKTEPGNRDSLSSDYIYDVCKDLKGNLWIATYDGGLNRMDQIKGTFMHFTLETGFPDNTIYSVLPDKTGNLWCSSNRGIIRLNVESGKTKLFTVKDGTQGIEFNSGAFFQCDDGHFIFGGIKGFNYFHPDNIKDNVYVPQVVITGFQIANKPVPVGPWEDGRILLTMSITETKAITLSYRDYVFSFDFAALHFISPERNQYAYKMEGLEKEWNYVGDRRFVSYTTLPSGNYRFRVKAANSDDVWNHQGTAIDIIVQPPFWSTWWFLSLMVMLGGALVLVVYRFRVRSLSTRKRELEVLVEERTHQLKKLSLVASKTDNAVFIMDERGRIEWVNEGFERMYGMKLEQFKLERGNSIFESSLNPNINETIAVCLEEKHSVHYETCMKTEIGLNIWTQVTLTPILDEAGAVVKIIGIETNITRLKESEAEIKRKSKELEKANAVARRERHAAEVANQSKSEFLARMSHEIRTPMNGVVGFTDMLLDTELSEEQVEYCRTISRSAEALVVLINDILDFSKIEAGELNLDAIDFDPELTVFDVCELIRPRLGNRNVELLCRVGDFVPTFVSGDAGRFRQVLINLLGNAVKFTQAGEIEVVLKAADKTVERVKLQVTVKDTGIGIPADKLEKVFDAFQQADGSTTRKYGGTGLGLAICRQIAHLMEGDITVQSTESSGSTFYFDAWFDRSDKRSEIRDMRQALTGKKVLVVDDNISNLEILIHVLRKHKMNTLQESDPHKVIPLLKRAEANGSPFDICILDVEMPEISGFTLAEMIRKQSPPLDRIPLLAFSSATLSRSKRYRDAGFDGFLPKPINRKKMVKMLERLLAGNKTNLLETSDHEIFTRHSINEDAKHSVHILLAEDNPINQKLARFLLTKAGYRLTIVQNGKEALDEFTAQPMQYDLILMDIQMPEMDGREATRQIRSKGFTEIPIIAMTAEAMKGDREKCLEAGMDDYISKPIKRESVLEVVSRYCLSGD